MNARDRIDMLAALGVTLYLTGDGELRARGPARWVSVAHPSLRQQRAEIIAHLVARMSVVDQESVAPPQVFVTAGDSKGLCPDCARQ